MTRYPSSRECWAFVAGMVWGVLLVTAVPIALQALVHAAGQ
jgi:hypothetical protein